MSRMWRVTVVYFWIDSISVQDSSPSQASAHIYSSHSLNSSSCASCWTTCLPNKGEVEIDEEEVCLEARDLIEIWVGMSLPTESSGLMAVAGGRSKETPVK